MIRRRATLILALGLVIGAPLLASQRDGRGKRVPQRTQTAAAGTLVGSFWSALVSLFAHDGGAMDPDGAHRSASAGAQAAVVQPPPAGCRLDPNGCRCR
jgi:uncharacterized membrane protein